MYHYERAASFRRFYANFESNMTFAEAAAVLGVAENASESEIKRAYKKLMLSAHTDTGGSLDDAKKGNIAYDIMTGKRPAADDYRRGPAAPGGGGHYSNPDVDTSWYQPSPRPKPEKQEVTFDEAASKAGVPSGMRCLFKTDTRYGRSGGDTHTAGFVIYGKTDTKHIFVGAENVDKNNAFTGEDVDIWSMRVYEFPIDKALSEVAPRAIRQAFADFKFCDKSYNAKVQILGDIPFNEKVYFNTTRSVAFKDAMVELGAVGDDHAWVKDRKVTVELVVTRGKDFNDEGIRLNVNGKTFDLGHEAYVKMNPKAMRFIFGDYHYPDSKKVITRMPKAKAILEWMVKNLDLDATLKGLLETAAAQAK